MGTFQPDKRGKDVIGKGGHMRSCTRCGCPLLERLLNCPYCMAACTLPSVDEVQRMLDSGLHALLLIPQVRTAVPPRRPAALIMLVLLLVLLPLLFLASAQVHAQPTSATEPSIAEWPLELRTLP